MYTWLHHLPPPLQQPSKFVNADPTMVWSTAVSPFPSPQGISCLVAAMYTRAIGHWYSRRHCEGSWFHNGWPQLCGTRQLGPPSRPVPWGWSVPLGTNLATHKRKSSKKTQQVQSQGLSSFSPLLGITRMGADLTHNNKT